MASSFLTSFLVSFLLSILLFTSTNVKGDLVTDVCVNALDPSLCEKLIRSDPRSNKTTNLETLGAITFNLTIPLVKSTISMVFSLRDNAADPTLKGLYQQCAAHYTDADMRIIFGKGAFFHKDTVDVFEFLSQSIYNLQACDNSFSKQKLDEDEKLKQDSLSLQNLCTAIKSMASHL
ncbi:hypothetical protein A4A49_63845 [Nicotiana attenuata]|uniref:Pectinesterase inhibitor domain-containing protein n=1 Tax=Nicotiana attenuata TaxID=49451 RepID=A0A1J6K9Z3_NICAT|nr:hypothetical protein A4A49_63845 [Nicotiana attenuata]